MPSNKKNYKRKNYKIKNKKSFKHKSDKQIDPKRKNFKFIKRSKEAEASQRRQKQIEDQYKNKNAKLLDKNISDEENQIEENPYDELISCFQDKGFNNARESSSSDEEEIQEEEQIEQDNLEDCENEDVEENELEIDNDDGNKIMDDDDSTDDSVEDDTNENIDDSLGKDEIILEEELDEETELNENSKNPTNNDTFSKHFDFNLESSHLDNINQNVLFKKPIKTKSVRLNWPIMGYLHIEIPLKLCEDNSSSDKNLKLRKQILSDEPENFAEEGVPPTLIDYKNFDWKEHYVKSQIGINISIANINNLSNNNSSETSPSLPILTELQAELFSIINNYQNLFYPHRTLNNGEEIRLVYCLHVLNHMLKTRTKILHHNAKLSAAKSNKNQNVSIIPDMYKDQGFVRPKVLILLPFRESVHKVVNMLALLYFGENSEKMKKNGGVVNYKRFIEEYTGDTIRFPKHNPKPEDYEKTFAGNTDDTFRIGLSLTKKCIKLYTDFYSSDIIIASPLGLRMIIGAAGDKDRDYDFLSSIEIVILDQAELFFAQNWDHLLHVFEHFDLQLQSVRNTDFSRVRSWCLKGHTKFYRQMLLFTTHELAEFRSLFNKQYNYQGKIQAVNPIIGGTIKNVLVPIPQMFHKINVTSIQSSFDERFKYFINEILPQYRNLSMMHCMIYIPSYFDYVRIRNYFKSETINFVQICEYTKDGKIARARDMFYHSGTHFLLYSERAHFFRRTRIKGIRHLIMYQPTYWPNFYPEIINLMQSGNQNVNDGLETSSMSITILYTKYDLLQVSSIIGTDRALKMFNSNRTTHMFMNST